MYTHLIITDEHWCERGQHIANSFISWSNTRLLYVYYAFKKKNETAYIIMTETFQFTVFTVLCYLYFEMCLAGDVFAFG